MKETMEKAFKLEIAIGYRLEKTVKLLRLELQQAFKNAGYPISAYQFHILYRLWQNEGIFLSQLKEYSVIDNSKITREVDSLEKHGYVERRLFNDDRRKAFLFLTEKGKELQKILLPVQIKHYERTLIGVTQEELEQLDIILKKVEKNFL
jgi:MarR family transcriptional regulator, organic hydroperoxide resistance regulator